jgi:hypothetical protein
MKKPLSRVSSLCFALSFSVLLAPSVAHAQSPKIFVASYGSDANDGLRGSPKRNFQAAHDAVAASGEIVVLDTAGYGTLTINKSVGISVPPGVTGFITVTAGATGITVNAASTDTVNLRGLTINAPALGPPRGILCQNIGILNVQDCSFSGFTYGVDFAPPSNNATLLMNHCTIRDCTIGVRSQPSGSALAQGTIRDCLLTANGVGATFAGFNRFTVIDSVLSLNGTGLSATPTNAHVLVKNCQIAANNTGLSSTGSSTCLLRVDGCSITFHEQNQLDTALVTSGGGRILSRGNNTLTNNAFEGAFTGTYSPL